MKDNGKDQLPAMRQEPVSTKDRSVKKQPGNPKHMRIWIKRCQTDGGASRILALNTVR